MADREPLALREFTVEEKKREEQRAQQIEILNMFQEMVWPEKRAIAL